MKADDTRSRVFKVVWSNSAQIFKASFRVYESKLFKEFSIPLTDQVRDEIPYSSYIGRISSLRSEYLALGVPVEQVTLEFSRLYALALGACRRLWKPLWSLAR